MFISSAIAQEAAQAPAGAGSSFLIQLVLLIGIFYFLILRPQQKRMKKHKDMLANLTKGDKILTGGGILGKITKLDNDKDVLHVQIADTVTVQVARSSVSLAPNAEEMKDSAKASKKNSQSSSSDKKVANDN